MNNYPLINFVILFICGIIISSLIKISSAILLPIFGIVLLIVLIIFFGKPPTIKIITPYLTIVLIIIFGLTYHSSFNKENVYYPFDLPKISNAEIYGRVQSIDLIKNDKLTFTMNVDSINGLKFKTDKFNMFVRVKDNNKPLLTIYDSIQVGNKIVVKGTILKPRDRRNPGEYDYANYLAQQNISALVYLPNIRGIRITSHDAEFIPNTIYVIRKNIDQLISSLHNRTTTSLLRGLLLADRSLIENEIKDEFINAGVIHVLAVSGLHVGFIIIIFVFLFKRFNIYLRYTFTLIALTCFVIITNSPPSVVRASIMAGAIIIAPMSGRNYSSLNSLSLAAFIILLFDPDQLFNPGFQLSFSAVLAILLLYPRLSAGIYKLKIKYGILKYLLLFFAVSFAAQVGTLPFTLIYFSRLSIVAFAANFIVIPMIGMIVGLGILSLATGVIFFAVGNIFANTNELLTYVLFNFVRWIGNPKYSFISVYEYSIYDALIFYLLLFFVIYSWKYLSTWKPKMIMMVFSILTLFTLMKIDNRNLFDADKLTLMAIDVGQGDSFLIKFPNGKTALVDAGDALENYDSGKLIIAPILDRLGITKIDYGFISHVDADHYRGYYYLIEQNRIARIFKPKIDTTLEKDVELEKFLQSKNIPVYYYSKKSIPVGNARIYVLNDTTNTYFQNMDSNNKSGMIKIVYGNNSFLFAGDAGVKSEKYYEYQSGNFLGADILKAGHHGSKTSTSESFLEKVKPKIAIISAGVANKFNHPHKEIIDKFNRRNIIVLRTDERGAIILESDGTKIQNINWKKADSGFIF